MLPFLATLSDDDLHKAGIVVAVATWELVKFVAGLYRGRKLNEIANDRGNTRRRRTHSSGNPIQP